jgi:hypothetical protein
MTTQTITIIPKKVTGGNEDLIMLPRSEFEKMSERFRNMPAFKGYEMINYKKKQYRVPVYQLNNKATARLDKEVKKALQEFKAGNLVPVRSLADVK